MSFIVSPNMSLSIPTVGQEPGPQYAFDVNTSLTLVDQHDHSPGRGVQITPSGININADLSFNSHSAINLINATFISQSSGSAALQSVYVAPGSESPALQDLWYNDSAGNAIQITAGGQVNATAATIPGESYAAGTFFWKQTQDSLPTTPANFDIGSVTIRPNTALTTLGVTLSPPSAIASAYTISLPLLPSQTSFLTIDPSGNLASSAQPTIPAPGTGVAGDFLRLNSVGAYELQTSDFNVISPPAVTPYVASISDDLILDNTGIALTVNLYTAVGNTGATIRIKRLNTSLGNPTTLQAFGSETIDGKNIQRLRTSNESVTLVSDGANWQVISHEIPSFIHYGTVTSTGFGTPAPLTASAWRVGQNLIVNGYLTAGTVSGSILASFALPSGLSIDGNSDTGLTRANTTAQNGQIVGTYGGNGNTINGWLITATTTSTDVVYFGNSISDANTGATLPQVGSQIASTGQLMAFQFTVPISGWWG